MIEASTSRVEQGAGLVHHAGDTIRAIVDQVQEISRMIADVADGSVQQKGLIEAATAEVSKLQHLIDELGRQADTAERTAQDLQQMAQALNRSLHKGGAEAPSGIASTGTPVGAALALSASG